MDHTKILRFCLLGLLLISFSAGWRIKRDHSDSHEEDSHEHEEDHEHEHPTEPLSVTTILHEPFMMFKNDSSSEGNDRYYGYLADMLAEVAKRAEFEYTIFVVEDRKYGSRNRDSTWSGMIGELMQGKAHLAVAPLTVNDERKMVVDFSIPYMDVKLSALVTRDSGIETLEDLYNQSKVAYGCMEGGSTQNQFRSTPKSPFSMMWAEMASASPSAFVASVDEGVQRTRTGNYSLILEDPIASYLSFQKPCTLTTIKPFTMDNTTQHYAFAMKQGDEFLEDIDDALYHMEEEGWMKEGYKKWWGKSDCATTDCPPDDEDGVCAGATSLMTSVFLILSALYVVFSSI